MTNQFIIEKEGEIIALERSMQELREAIVIEKHNNDETYNPENGDCLQTLRVNLNYLRKHLSYLSAELDLLLGKL